jgi:hypothetical protein
MPCIYFERRKLLHEGIRLSYEDETGVAKPVAHINGNDFSFHGPIILTGIDAHVVYGLSHPQVISTILQMGPQSIVTTKELAHNLFEHGMKAALGKQRFGNSVFLATLESYYRVHQSIGEIRLGEGTEAFYRPPGREWPILIRSGGPTGPEDSKIEVVELNRIQDYKKIELRN